MKDRVVVLETDLRRADCPLASTPKRSAPACTIMCDRTVSTSGMDGAVAIGVGEEGAVGEVGISLLSACKAPFTEGMGCDEIGNSGKGTRSGCRDLVERASTGESVELVAIGAPNVFFPLEFVRRCATGSADLAGMLRLVGICLLACSTPVGAPGGIDHMSGSAAATEALSAGGARASPSISTSEL